MKEIDESGIKLCKAQGELFRLSQSENISSAVFIRRFMNSDLAERIDNNSYFFSSDSNESSLAEINKQYQNKSYGSKKYGEEELYWMGYIYRYWCYCFEKSSKSVYKIINATKLRELYYPYHTLDPKKAIERICEARNITQEDDLKRGVIIFREIINRKK